MKPIHRLVYIPVLILFLSTITFATNWYVDKNASGSNNGTSWANAWEELNQINWGSISAGDNIYVSGGSESTVYTTALEISGLSGTAANFITITTGMFSSSPSGHDGKVIIDGGGTADNIQLHSCNYILIKGFECRNSVSRGVYVEDYCTNVILDSLYVHDMADAGIFFNGANAYTIDSSVVRNCTILTPLMYAGETDGLAFQNTQRSWVYNNYIRQQNQDPLAHNDCIQGHLANGFVIYNNILISDSVNSPEGGGYAQILGSEHSNPVIVYNNFMYMGGIWYEDGADSRTFCLRWYDNDPMPPTWVFNNTIISNGFKTRAVECEYRGTFINNIFAQYTSSLNGRLDPIMDIAGTVSNPIPIDGLRSNLWYRSWGESMFPTGYQVTGNGNTGYPSSWSAWVNTYGGTGIYQEDPLLVDNIGYEPNQGTLGGELQAGSPAINAGDDLTNLKNFLQSQYGIVIDIEHDLLGQIRNTSSPTIGAYEYNSGPDLTPPKVTSAALLDSVTLVVNFSEALDQATAEDENNYSITNNINVLNASLSSSKKVTLQTSPHSPGSYIVTVINVEDLAGNPIAQNNTAEYILLPPDTLVMFPVQNVEGIIIEPDHTPEKTIDGLGALGGDPDSRWAAEPMPEELIFDLGTNRTICKTKLSFYNWNAGRVYDYSVSISSDHNNWVTIVPQATSASNQEWTVDEFPAVDARYVRVHFINNNQSTWAGLWEAEIWGIDIVPVELISFNAEYYDGKVYLEWITATETNCYGFEIQRRGDYTSYESIGFVSGNGTSTNRHTYNFRDSNLHGGKYYYRLKDISNNGEFNYSFEIQVDVPEISTFQLMQNYPNPFNPSTAIEFYVPKLSRVKLIVYNMIGQEVQTLVDGDKVPGLYEVEFNAANLPSGIYFYKLHSANFIETKKMILMK